MLTKKCDKHNINTLYTIKFIVLVTRTYIHLDSIFVRHCIHYITYMYIFYNMASESVQEVSIIRENNVKELCF